MHCRLEAICYQLQIDFWLRETDKAQSGRNWSMREVTNTGTQTQRTRWVLVIRTVYQTEPGSAGKAEVQLSSPDPLQVLCVFQQF